MFSQREMDMCHGPLMSKMLLFALPLMLSGVLQLLFNAADLIVVGRFAGSDALAQVGATGAMINLIINTFMGLSVGVNVIVAQAYGARDIQGVSRASHCAVCISLLGGVAVGIPGMLTARALMAWMDTPADVIDGAVAYMRIYFAGLPMIALYNFGSAVLRSAGDTVRPLLFLVIGGVINVLLNLFFVIVLRMEADGVALATVISQGISAVLVLYWLTRPGAGYTVTFKQLRLYKKELLQFLRIGIPAGINGALFSFSNVLIQSNINAFGPVVMAANTAASNIEGFINTALNSFHHTALAFTAQNLAARRLARLKRIFWSTMLLYAIFAAVLTAVLLLLRRDLLGIYTKDPAVLEAGYIRFNIVGTFCFVCAFMDIMVGLTRGYGSSMAPTVISLTGVCGLRILWIYTVLPLYPTLEVLYAAYPVSWLITAILQTVCFSVVRRRALRRLPPEEPETIPAETAPAESAQPS